MKQSTKAKIRSVYVRTMDFLRRTPFAHTHCTSALPYSVEISQPFKPSPTLESKKHNLREAAKCINTLLIHPNEVFSFWHVVGNPNNKRRFKEGRSIHAGVLSIDVGGGLCQASGIIHHLALLVGLKVEERFNHSVDLYTDETRFAPLGTDATVFYGFKDLRLRNTLPHPIQFEIIVEEKQVRALIKSDSPIQEQNISYDIQVDAFGNKSVNVLNEAGEIISKSNYAPLNN